MTREATTDYQERIGFSRAVRIRDSIAVSGTAPILEDGGTAYPGNVYEQTRTCLKIMEDAVINAGGSLSDTLRTRIYITDRSHWPDAARAHAEFFQQIRPACTFVIVTGFIDKDWLVETEMDCLVNNRQVL